MVLGKDVLPQPNTPAAFSFGVVMIAMLIHFVLSPCME